MPKEEEKFLFRGQLLGLGKIVTTLNLNEIPISEKDLRYKVKEQKRQNQDSEIIDVTESVYYCIAKRWFNNRCPYIRKGVIEYFGRDIAAKIENEAEDIKYNKKRIKKAEHGSEEKNKEVKPKRKTEKGKEIYPFKGKFCTARTIAMYYAKKGMPIKADELVKKLNELREKEEELTEQQILEMVKNELAKRIIQPSVMYADIIELYIEEFGLQGCKEIFSIMQKYVNNHQKQRRSDRFRAEMKKQETISAQKGHTTSIANQKPNSVNKIGETDKSR